MSISVSLIKPPTTGILSDNIDDIVGAEIYYRYKIAGRINRVPVRTAHIPIGLLMVASVLNRRIPDLTFHYVDLALSGEVTEINSVQYGQESLVVTRIGGDVKNFEKILGNCDYHLVSGQLVTERRNVFEVARQLKQISKGKIVVGGHDASVNSEIYADNESVDLVYRGTDISDLAGIVKGIIAPGTKIINGGRNYLLLNGIHPRFDVIPDLSKYNVSPEGALPRSVEQVGIPVYFTLGCAEGIDCCGHNRLGGCLEYDLESMVRYARHVSRFSKTFLIMDEQPAGLMLAQHDGAFTIKQLFTELRNLGAAWEFVNTVAVYRILKYVDSKGDTELIPSMFGNELIDGRLRGCFGACLHFGLMRDDSISKAINFLELVMPYTQADYRMSFNTLSGPDTSLEELKVNFAILGKLNGYMTALNRGRDSPIKIFYNHYFRTEESSDFLMPEVIQNPEIKCYTFMPWPHPQFDKVHSLVTAQLINLNQGILVNDRGEYNFH